MGQRYGWLTLLVLAALLLAACGPEMATPTPQQVTAEADAPTEAAAENPTEVQEDVPTAPPQTPAERPVSADDWHVLGSPDAPVTIVEYSDFQ